MKSPIAVAILFASLSSVATAQFGFFDQMFRNQGEQQREQQPQAGSQWSAQAQTGAIWIIDLSNDTFTLSYSSMLLVFMPG